MFGPTSIHKFKNYSSNLEGHIQSMSLDGGEWVLEQLKLDRIIYMNICSLQSVYIGNK